MELGKEWTRLVWFVRCVSKGAWRRCRRCEKFTECYSYGEGVMQHRAYLERLVGRPNPMPALPGRDATWVVCINWAGALDQALNTHEGCLCRDGRLRQSARTG